MKKKKYLCFRFDIDTHKCIRDGVPPLLSLFAKYDLAATFFLNVGKSIDHLHALQSLFSKKTNDEDVYTLSALKKLGKVDYLQALFFNPVIGKSYKKSITQLLQSTNEIGLHGGKNHELWHYNAKNWDTEQIRQEIEWGITVLKSYKQNVTVDGFASPGWNGSSVIESILPSFGFSYISDTHTDQPDQQIKKVGSLVSIPTNISGEPGGVGYIEHCRAKKMRDKEVLADFKKKLLQRNKFAVLYDHPYYVGVQEIGILEEMIKVGRSMDFTIVPMKQLLTTI